MSVRNTPLKSSPPSISRKENNEDDSGSDSSIHSCSENKEVRNPGSKGKTVAQTFHDRRKRSRPGATIGSGQRVIMPFEDASSPTINNSSRIEAAERAIKSPMDSPEGQRESLSCPPSTAAPSNQEQPPRRTEATPSRIDASSSITNSNERPTSRSSNNLKCVSTTHSTGTLTGTPAASNKEYTTKARPSRPTMKTVLQQAESETVSPLAPRRHHEGTDDRRQNPADSPAAAAEDSRGSSSTSPTLSTSSRTSQDSKENATDREGHATGDAEQDTVHNGLDRIATRAEEKYVMSRLLNDIRTAEDEAHRHPSSLIGGVAYATGSPEIDSTAHEIELLEPWKTPLAIGPFPRVPWRKKSSRRKTAKDSKTRKGCLVEEDYIISPLDYKMSLPKLVPDEMGGYEDGQPSFLFTRPQFIKNVVLEAEPLIGALGPAHKEWTATLTDHNPKEPHSYLLEASGSEEALEILMNLTQKFVRQAIERLNLELLLDDGASLVVNVKCPVDPRSKTAQQALGASFSSTISTNSEGVYIKSMKPKGVLAKAICDPDAYSKGCALLAVNKKKVSNLSEVQELVMEANNQFPRPRTATKVELSLCLSKFADLSGETCKISKWDIQRRDGAPYDEEEYETFRVDKYIEWSQKHPIKPSKMASKPLKDKEDTPRPEEGASSSEESAKSATKSRKRRKQTQSVLESDSDSDSYVDTIFSDKYESSSDEDVRKPRAKKAKIASFDKDSKPKAKPQGYAIFKQFEDKVKPLIALDYKDTRINIKSVCSSMWKKYKDLFGEDARCDDNCQFLMWLPELTENVIKDHIEKQKAKSIPVETEEELEKMTRGIAKNFVPKFIVKLRDQYPDETDAQLVHRLVDMWEMHQRNRLYGMRCLDGCGCLSEWDQIFGKGDKAAAKKYVSMMKRASLLSQSGASSENKAASSSKALSGPVVPRKKRVLEQNPTKINDGESKKPKLSGLISSMTSRKAIFEVAFETSIPLGGYFRTRQNQCQVFSVFMRGQMAKEARITNGCTVVSVKTRAQGAPISISSHSELQNLYENAKKTWSTLYILFGSQGVKPTNDNRMNRICWNMSGQWVGTPNLEANDGWAGGSTHAQRKKPPPRKTTEKNQMNTMRAPLNMLVNKIAGDTTQNTKGRETPEPEENHENTHDSIVEEWNKIVNTAKPGHKTREPTKKLLVEKSSFPPEEPTEEKGLRKLLPTNVKLSRRERTHDKKVMFSIPNNEEIFFCKNDAPNERWILQTKTTKAKPKQTLQIVDPEQDLVNALRNKSVIDVLQILESQEFHLALTNQSLDLEAILQNELSMIGKELKKDNDNISLTELNDLRAKHKVLKIYINCIHLIEKTLALKKWYELTLQVKYIDLQHQSSIIDEIGGDVAVKLSDGNLKEKFPSLPAKKFSEHISYVNENLTYTMCNNKNFRFEKRHFVIDLKKVSQTFAEDRMIGIFNIELNDIEDKCMPNEKPTECIHSLSNNGFHELLSGHITLNVTKKSASKTYVQSKKHEITKKLRDWMEAIDRFNKDPKNPPGAKLTSNILCMGGKSLLHAAVVLGDASDLVKTMLKLGANPRSNYHCGMGTPLSLAQRNLHSALDKERHMRLKNLDTIQQQQHCNQLGELVKMLQENVIEFPAAIATLAHPSSEPLETRRDGSMRKGDHSQSVSKNLSAPNHPRPPPTPLPPPPKVPTAGTVPPSQGADSASKVPSNKHWETSELRTSRSDSLSPPHASSFDSTESQRSRSSSPLPSYASFDSTESTPLPKAKFRDWARDRPSVQALQFCNQGPNCRFLKKGICRYWHNALSPLPNEQQGKMPSLPKNDGELPALANSKVEFLRASAPNGMAWWTAAYIFTSAKRVVYVQKVVEYSGLVDEDGVVWFRSKDEAIYSLRCTVYLFDNGKNIQSLQQQQENQVKKKQNYGISNPTGSQYQRKNANHHQGYRQDYRQDHRQDHRRDHHRDHRRDHHQQQYHHQDRNRHSSADHHSNRHYQHRRNSYR